MPACGSVWCGPGGAICGGTSVKLRWDKFGDICIPFCETSKNDTLTKSESSNQRAFCINLSDKSAHIYIPWALFRNSLPRPSPYPTFPSPSLVARPLPAADRSEKDVPLARVVFLRTSRNRFPPGSAPIWPKYARAPGGRPHFHPTQKKT